MILSSVVLPEPLSPSTVRNSPSAISREISRSTRFLPNFLAKLRMLRRGGLLAEFMLVLETAPEVVAEATNSRNEPCVVRYCAAFTSFQISLYLARRGTFCQKYSRFW